ncbi:protein of unknown function [Nitrospira defluvii]|uniref:Uncharacterized protein n=1 Tax=Nitrospira defluvii TaxID=330214 RepID=D8P932_9BACT|nr:protein of unknown function [Nitrospira defluvii]
MPACLKAPENFGSFQPVAAIVSDYATSRPRNHFQASGYARGNVTPNPTFSCLGPIRYPGSS